MPWKTDDKGAIVVQDEKPVWVHDDGKEIAFDAPQTLSTIKRLNGECKGHREAKEAAEEALKTFGNMKPDEVNKLVADRDKYKSEAAAATAETRQVIANSNVLLGLSRADAIPETLPLLQEKLVARVRVVDERRGKRKIEILDQDGSPMEGATVSDLISEAKETYTNMFAFRGSGGGARQSRETSIGSNSIRRSDFDRMNPHERAAAMAQGRTITD